MSKNKILLSLDKAAEICTQLRRKHKSIVLAGGVFDILHYGHLKFLKAAKKQADILIVAIESDKNVRRRKGNNRPLHSENVRAEILAELECVDYVIILPEMHTKDYYQLVQKLKPAIIAVTKGDTQIENKRKQAESIGGKLKVVTPLISAPSTTKLAKILKIE